MDSYKLLLDVVSFLFSLWVGLKSSIFQMWRLKDLLLHYVWLWLYALIPRKRIILDKNFIPKHLAVLLTEDDICLTNLADLASFSVKYGVQKFTIYDPTGFVTSKNNNHLLSELIETKLRGKCSFAVNGCLYSKSAPITTTTTSTDCNKKRPVFDIFIVDYLSGRRSLVDTARQLAVEKSSEKIDAKTIERILNSKNLYEVDFVIKFGPVNSVLAFPPMSLPVTEFVFMSTLKNFDEISFVECLERYSSRDRRHGK